MIWALLMSAWAQECTGELRAPPDAVSVAWVSPVRKHVGRNGWVEVVRSDVLRDWVANEGAGSVGRLLQRLGMRRASGDPRRRYKVTIFDVRSQDLCRPLAGYDDPAAVEGLVTCPARLGRETMLYAGCGFTTDLATSEVGLELYRAQWDDLARNGFCVLPAERFVQRP